jgi:signal transduction histidine kinase
MKTVRHNPKGASVVSGKKDSHVEKLNFLLSHELRASLRAIEGFSQVILDDHVADLPKDVRDYLSIICNEARKGAALIEEALSFSRNNKTSP